MTTNARAIRPLEAIQPDWETVKGWAKATFTRERMAELGFVGATFLVTGFLGAVLFKGIQTYSLSGF